MIIAGIDTALLNQDYIKVNEMIDQDNKLYNQKDSKTDNSILNKDNTSTVGGKEAGTEELAKYAASSAVTFGQTVIKNTTGSGANGSATGITTGLNASNTHENKLNSIMVDGGDFNLNDSDILMSEILATQGSLGMHPITGQYLKTGVLNETLLKSLDVKASEMTESGIIKTYRNKLFGSGFQFLDSVDRRFEQVNEYVGYEYLRNFINHSAILHIYPGLPYYQAGNGEKNRLEWLQEIISGFSQSAINQESITVTKKPDPTPEQMQKFNEAIKFERNKSYYYEILKSGGEIKGTELQFQKTLVKNLKEKGFYDAEKNIFKLKNKDSKEDISKLNELFDIIDDANYITIEDTKKNTTANEAQNNEGGKGTDKKNSAASTALTKMLFSIFFATKYQQRLFTIRFTYEQYMRYVNMMCRAAALFLNLSVQGQTTFPQGTLVNNYEQGKGKLDYRGINFKGFHEIDWSNYRMMESADTLVKSTWSKSAELLGVVWTHVQSSFVNGLKGVAGVAATATLATPEGLAAEYFTEKLTGKSIAKTINDNLLGKDSIRNQIDTNIRTINSLEGNAEAQVKEKDIMEEGEKAYDKLKEQASIVTAGNNILNLLGDSTESIGKGFKGIFAMYGDVRARLEERTQSVEFMVEPVSPDEQFTNQTGASQIKQGLDQAAGIGSEVAFITQTEAIQDGAFGKAMEGALGLGKGIFSALNGLISNIPLGGSFIHNLVSGAIGAITGNRYIFPDIYQNSSSSASYNFKVNLISPYGDIYNYYMNIVVPLIHLYCLAWPRLVTANSSNCPFIVKAFIPGLMTCEMGIVDSMRVQKNSEGNRVSVNGFPLSVTVEFSIHELYHHNAISPWDDPLSVLNNECLLDYLSNMAGIHPTFARKQILAASLVNVLDLQTNLGLMIQNYFSDALLAWFGVRFK